MNNFIKTIFLKIADRLGFKLQDKTEFIDDYGKINDLSFTAIFANSVTTLTLLDSDITIKGDSERVKAAKDFLDTFELDRLPVAAEVALGTGDCLIKPYTDGERFGVDIIPNGNFIVCDSIGNFIRSVIIKCDEIKKDNGDLYERYEAQEVRLIQNDAGQTVPAVFIYHYAFKNGTEIPLASVPAWASIKPYDYIPNVNRLLLGRIKCPTVNRSNVNNSQGVKITYGLDGVMRDALEAYKRINSEMELSEKFIFADKRMFKLDKDGKPYIPKGKEKAFLKVTGNSTDDPLIQEYSPAVRITEMGEGFELVLKMLETAAGFSQGIITTPTTTNATATEIRTSLQKTFAFVGRFRRYIQRGVDDLMYSFDAISDRNGLTPSAEYEIVYDWSLAFIEEMTAEWNMRLAALGENLITREEVRAWLMDEDIDTAREKLPPENTMNYAV